MVLETALRYRRRARRIGRENAAVDELTDRCRFATPRPTEIIVCQLGALFEPGIDRALVLRDGERLPVPVDEIVPGDTVWFAWFSSDEPIVRRTLESDGWMRESPEEVPGLS